MAYLKLEDLVGSVEVIVFPDLYATSAARLVSDEPLLIHGILDRGEKGIKIKATRVEPLTLPQDPFITGLTIDLRAAHITQSDLIRLKEMLQRHKGPCSVHLKLMLSEERPESVSMIALDRTLWVNPTKSLLAELENAYGQGAVVVQYREKP